MRMAEAPVPAMPGAVRRARRRREPSELVDQLVERFRRERRAPPPPHARGHRAHASTLFDSATSEGFEIDGAAPRPASPDSCLSCLSRSRRAARAAGASRRAFRACDADTTAAARAPGRAAPAQLHADCCARGDGGAVCDATAGRAPRRRLRRFRRLAPRLRRRPRRARAARAARRARRARRRGRAGRRGRRRRRHVRALGRALRTSRASASRA